VPKVLGLEWAMTHPKPMPQLHPLVPAGEFDLSALLKHEPPTRWSPEPGEGVEGTVVKIVETKSFGSTAPVLFLLLDDGRYLTIRCAGVVLRRHLDENRPAPGDRVAVVFDGMRTSESSGREYASYRFGIRRQKARSPERHPA
jgi:hypothetical protein